MSDEERGTAIGGGAHVIDEGVDPEGDEGRGGSTRLRTVTLNSKRLTASRLKQLAGALGIPRAASSEDLRAMIEGKLTDDGRDPLRIQVVLRTVERGVHMTLQDEMGVFMEIEPPTVDAHPPDGLPGQESDETDSEEPTAVRELREEVGRLTVELETQKARVRELWKLNCDQLAEMDSSLLQKEEEIGSLRAEVARLRGTSPVSGTPLEDTDSVVEEHGTTRRDQLHRVRRGKAPPVEIFSGEDAESRLDDWLPTLQRTADWNGWTTEDLLIQLAGHLKGRALQEWNSIPATERNSYDQAVTALKTDLTQ